MQRWIYLTKQIPKFKLAGNGMMPLKKKEEEEPKQQQIYSKEETTAGYIPNN